MSYENIPENSTGKVSAFDRIQPSSGFTCDGYWSGTENRHHEHFIAMVPEIRYLDQNEILQSAIEECGFDRVPRYDPQKYQRDRELTPKEIEKKELYAEHRELKAELVQMYDHSVPAHMSGWARDEIVAWINANGHKDLQETIIMLHEQGA